MEFIVNSQSIAAYLFIQMYKEDPNADAPNDILQIADKFINACQKVSDIIPSFEEMDEQSIQFHLYEIGKTYYGTGKIELKEWFKHLYLLIMKTESGPRWGTYIKCFGPSNFEIILKK